MAGNDPKDGRRISMQNLSLLKERREDLTAEFIAVAAELARAFLPESTLDAEYEMQTLRAAAETLPKDAAVRSEFCKVLAAEAPAWADVSSFLPENEIVPSPLVAYFRNSMSNTAFSRFEKIIPELRAAYFDDFQQICEETAAGRCELCMLPVFDGQNGTLWSIRRLIERYDLHKTASVLLPMQPDSEEKVEFALFSPEFRRLPEANTLSLGAVFGSDAELPALIEGLDALGAGCVYCGRLPNEIFGEVAYDLDFDLSNGSETAICLYLDLFYPRVAGKGVFRRI